MGQRIHDLTHAISHGMSTYPAPYHPPVEVVQLGRLSVDGRESRRIVIGTHSGTHIDAPSHFIAGGATIDMAAPDVLIGPAFMVSFPDCSPGRAIGDRDLRAQIGSRRPERLVIRLDWSKRFGTERFYTDYPYLTADAAGYLVELGVRLVASDSPSCDDPRQSGPQCDIDSPNHKLLLGRGIVLVEYLTGLAAIQGDEFQLIALPLRISGGDGAPARVLAIEDAT